MIRVLLLAFAVSTLSAISAGAARGEDFLVCHKPNGPRVLLTVGSFTAAATHFFAHGDAVFGPGFEETEEAVVAACSGE